MIISTSLKKKENNRLVKNLIKQNYLKNQQKNDLKNLMNGLIKKKQVQTVNYLKSILMFRGLVTC